MTTDPGPGASLALNILKEEENMTITIPRFSFTLARTRGTKRFFFHGGKGGFDIGFNLIPGVWGLIFALLWD
ncbi:MAG: hypothetical protein JRI66_10730 [Deltaproteobacteria bacterium]|nr:hypothetical protein [Deltaproteobacteria bacterium]